MNIKSSPQANYSASPTEDWRNDIEQVWAVARLHAQARLATGEAISGPRDSEKAIQILLMNDTREKFCALFLDNAHKSLGFEVLSTGTIDGASVYPREVAKRALELNAAAVIFAHNHPSGETTPSRADISLTKRLKECLSLFDIRTLDHLIVSPLSVTSLAERGEL